MYTKREKQFLEKQNQRNIRELIGVSFCLGVNLTAPTRFKDSLRIINVILLVSSIVSLYAHWCHVMSHFDDLSTMAETICTAFQAIISIVKLAFLLFKQQGFYQLLEKVQTHGLLQEIEIFKKDFGINRSLKTGIERIMTAIWKETRMQLIYFLGCCIAIMSNYIFCALFINLYHQHKHTVNYEPRLPYPVTYNIWRDKGMSFPYYEIEMFLTTAAVYISAMAAVSFDGAFVVLSLHSVGLLEVLKLLTRNSTSPQVPQQLRTEYLRSYINHYNRTFEFVEGFQRLYQHISLSQFMLTLVVLGIVMFQTTVALESDKITFLRMLMYIAAAGTEITIYCYNGQRLMTASDDLPNAFYDCAWHGESREFRQFIQMMILRTNRILRMDISWFATMSLPTLMSLIQTSFSYFLLLRKVTSPN